MATLHVFGAPSAAQSTQTLAEPGLLGVSTAPVSPVSSEFSASAVTLAENDTARDETFTVLRPGTKRPCSQGLTTEQVTWDGPDDPENPKNWNDWRKWTACILPPFRLFPAEPLAPRSHPRRPVTLTLDLSLSSDIPHHLDLRVPLPALLLHHGPGAHLDRRGAAHSPGRAGAARAVHLPARLRAGPVRAGALLRGLGPHARDPAGQPHLHPLHHLVRLRDVAVADHRLSLPCRAGRERQCGGTWTAWTDT